MSSRLYRGDLLPRILTPPPGPRCRALSQDLRRYEAPGINTLPATGKPAAVLWQEARGANVLDADGNRYVDLTAGFGVASVGHRHPRVVAAVRRQSGRLLHGLGDAAAHPGRVALAAELAARAPVDDAVVYFAVSGADAVEIALKTALLASGRPEIVVFDPSYHGLTLGALAASSRPAFRQPFAPYLHRRLHRLPFACPPAAIAELLDERPAIGCLLLEPIVGREGVLVPPEGWLPAVAAICRQRRVLVVADEIFTGFGRTGRLFAVEHEGVRPDLLCCGKALAGGLPIGVVLGERSLMDAWSAPGEARHTATFVAHPLACAAGLAVLEVLAQEDLVGRAARWGERLGRRLATWPRRFAAVRACRGRGLLWGIELTTATAAGRLSHAARQRGLWLLAGGASGRVAQLAPPLVITDRQLDWALDLLEQLCAELDRSA